MGAAERVLAVSASDDLPSMAGFFIDMFDTLLPILIGFGVLFFVWAVVKYIRAGGDAETRSEARKFMVNGIVILFIIVSIWGFVNMLDATFDFDDTLPTMPNIITTP